ncbi:MAG: hypothetical protein ABFS19_07785 [Thermodesulfobacteriota bacterium]
MPRDFFIALVTALLLFSFQATASVAADFSGHSTPSFLELIYIDAAAGEAAGGHSAVKLGRSVYHYQFHEDGLLVLARQNWEDFRYYYNDLSNRTLEIVSIPLSDSEVDIVRQSFLDQYLTQMLDLGVRTRLQDELSFYEQLQSGTVRVTIPGLGLFDRQSRYGSGTVKRLKSEILQRLPEGGLEARLAEVNRLIGQQLHFIDKAVEDDHPRARIDSGHHLRELAALREGLLILVEDKGLDPQALIRPSQNRVAINKDLAIILEEFRLEIVQAISELLQFPHCDRGTALLVQIARVLAIESSLQGGELVTLAPWRQQPGDKKSDDAVREEDLLQFFHREAQLFSERGLETFIRSAPSIRSISYSMLEKLRGNLLLAERAVNDPASGFSPPPQCGVPCLPGTVELRPANRKKGYGLMVDRVRSELADHQRQLEKLYSYSLFNKNCSTELIRSINKSFVLRERAARALGGYLEPGSGLSFVPFGLHDAALKSFNVDDVEELPSYRLRHLARLVEKEGDTIWFRESNTLSSTLYSPWKEDGYFLFFTDDKVASRPVLGLINLVYGLLQTAAGVVMAPFDFGDRFGRALDGVIFSLPELFFFNIRKGSFQIIDDEGNGSFLPKMDMGGP